MTETTPSTVERFFLAVWTISTTTSAILGNLVVLIAIKRKSIKLDRISVVIIGNLAVADMGCGLYVMTNFINIVAGRYVLGEKICYISVFLCNFFFSVSILSLCSLNVSKATCLAVGHVCTSRVRVQMWQASSCFTSTFPSSSQQSGQGWRESMYPWHARHRTNANFRLHSVSLRLVPRQMWWIVRPLHNWRSCVRHNSQSPLAASIISRRNVP